MQVSDGHCKRVLVKPRTSYSAVQLHMSLVKESQRHASSLQSVGADWARPLAATTTTTSTTSSCQCADQRMLHAQSAHVTIALDSRSETTAVRARESDI